MKRCILLLLIPIVLFCANGCSYQNRIPQSDTFFAMDTVFIVSLPPDTDRVVFNRIQETVTAAERRYSKTIDDSMVSKFNQSSKEILLSADDAKLLSEILRICKLTKGAYDPTVEPLISLWGFGTDVAAVPNNEKIQSALQNVGYSELVLAKRSDASYLTKKNPNVHLDLGGAVKGYVCDTVCRDLENDYSYGCLDFGGTIGVFGSKPDGTKWEIGVRDPNYADKLVGTVTVDSGFLAVSGDYERYFVEDGIRYCHIIDPETGYPPVGELRCCAVLSGSGLEADILSTALFVLGADDAMDLYRANQLEFEAIFVFDDETVLITPGLTDSFHCRESYTKREY